MPKTRQSVATVFTAAATLIVVLTAFLMSSGALTQVATMAGLTAPMGLAIVLDGGTIVATIVALAGRVRRGFPVAVVLVCTALSVYCNILHTATALTRVEAGIVAAIPPFVLLASTHVLALALAPEAGSRVAKTGRVAKVSAVAKPVAVATAARAQVATPRAPVAVAVVRAWQATNGRWQTGAEVAAQDGRFSAHRLPVGGRGEGS
jgi:hypothetical protein